MKKLIYPFACTLLLAACSGGGAQSYQSYLSGRNLGMPEPEKFVHCHGYGCKIVTPVTLSDANWRAVEKTFRPKAKTPEKEREQIKKAIGAFETRVGAIAGTDTDIHGTFDKLGNDQHDCVDESTNTTIYLALLEKKGLLRFHETAAPDTRIPLVHYAGTWPHQTAVIREKKSGTLFAVDSWFHDNGVPAEIVPLPEWKSGWKPG